MPALDGRREQMLGLAQRWRESGVKARTFAQEHGVTPWTLYYWRQRLPGQKRRVRRRRHRSRRATFAPVRVVADATEVGGTVEILFASGDRVRVSAAVSADLLRRVVQVLRAC